jgi:hypothetical protein
MHVLLQVVTKLPDLNPLWDAAIKFVAVAASILGTFLIGVVTKYVQGKMKIQNVDAEKRWAEEALKKGITRAEEWARKTFLVTPDQPQLSTKPTGEQKASVAIKHAISLYPPLAKESKQKLADQVDALLVELRPRLSLLPQARPESMRPMDVGHLSGLSQIPPVAGIPLEAHHYEDAGIGKNRSD